MPHCNWRTLPSSQTPSLPALSFPLPPTPLALFARLREGAAQAVRGGGVLGCKGVGGGASKRHLGPDPHLGVLEHTPHKLFEPPGLLQESLGPFGPERSQECRRERP